MAQVLNKYKMNGSRAVALGHLRAGMAQGYVSMQSTLTQAHRIA